MVNVVVVQLDKFQIQVMIVSNANQDKFKTQTLNYVSLVVLIVRFAHLQINVKLANKITQITLVLVSVLLLSKFYLICANVHKIKFHLVLLASNQYHSYFVALVVIMMGLIIVKNVANFVHSAKM